MVKTSVGSFDRGPEVVDIVVAVLTATHKASRPGVLCHF